MSSASAGLVCAGCGAEPPADEPYPFRCPAARAGDDVDHVLGRCLRPPAARFAERTSPQPFLRFRELFHAHAVAGEEAYAELLRELDGRVAAVDGSGFARTPCRPAPELAAELGLATLAIKDETGGVAGSHKARHLMGVLLQLEAARRAGLAPAEEPPLAIASCGNAALAAAVLARAADRRLSVYVPPDAEPAVLGRLEELGAELVPCPRAPDGPPGDPCYRAFRQAVDGGALPFTCQGSENGLVIEGGQTLAWELVLQLREAGEPAPDLVAVQVGGGALFSAVSQALFDARAAGLLERLPRLLAVQTTSARPLERAWRRVVRGAAARLGAELPPAAEDAALAAWVHPRAEHPAVQAELAHAARHRAEYMWPWEEEPCSVAEGILDDETYDWHAVVRALVATGGRPVAAAERTLEQARDRARALTGVPVSATGAAGLAGLYELHAAGRLAAGLRAAVLFTGIQR